VLSRREVDLPHLPRATSRGRLLARQRASHGDVPAESTVGVIFRAKRYRQVGVRAQAEGHIEAVEPVPSAVDGAPRDRGVLEQKLARWCLDDPDPIRCEARALLLRQFSRGAEA
jgi:hypothetical protein